jgi:hypothetical protein
VGAGILRTELDTPTAYFKQFDRSLKRTTGEADTPMNHHRVNIAEAESVGDDDHLARILNIAITTTENVVALERQRRDGHTPGEEPHHSPRDLLDGEPVTLAELEHALPSLVVEPYQHPSNSDEHQHPMATTGRNDIAEAMEAAADGHATREILGDCPYNARRLYDELRDRDITAHIVRGGLDLPREDGRPSSLDEAVETGVVHWWVEALVDGEWLTLDIASEAPEHYSEELVSATRPPVYVPFEIDPPDTEMFATR